MTCRTKNSEPADQTTQYASNEDFCRLFSDNVDSLYQLAFLLTGDLGIAEQCFVSGLESSVASNKVFREWAHSWAKRTIIQLAIRALKPKPLDPESAKARPTQGVLRDAPQRHKVVGSVLSLDDFDRFVFVMSVLERYSEHECALLLSCTPPDVREARTRALRQITGERPRRTEEDLFAREVARDGRRFAS